MATFVFLAIFRNEITTILTPSTSEGEVGVVTFFVLVVPDYESAMVNILIYKITRSKICDWLKITRKVCD